jgi:nucleoside-diphosphate-sugar epimerase
VHSQLKQRIAVTGATGFIGRSVCRRLLAENYSLSVLIRQPRNISLDTFGDAEIVQGDLADLDSLSRLVGGTDAVIHCAGKVRGATQAHFDRVNVDGTRNLLRAIKSVGTRPRLLAISSLAAREPQLSFYATSKRRAERLLEQVGDDLAWTILRPPAVYGPGDRELLPLFRLMARGIALTAGSPESRVSLLYVDDLSSAVTAWLQMDTSANRIFEVDDGHISGYDWHDISGIVGDLCDRRVRVVQANSWWLDLPAWLNSRIGAAFGTAPMLTPEKLRELRHQDWVCDSSAFQQAADWRPRMTLAAGLRATPNWAGYRSDGAESVG